MSSCILFEILKRSAGAYVHYISQTIQSGALEDGGSKMEEDSNDHVQNVKQLLPKVSPYYQELQEIFGEGLVPYISVMPGQQAQASV